jgi:uncharacterized damage-inducible protein DinB
MSVPTTIAENLLPEFDREMAGARRALERTPEARYDWRPHAKSWTLRELVTHIAQIPEWGSLALGSSELELVPEGGRVVGEDEPVGSRAELLARFDAYVRATRAALAAASDEQLRGMWTMRARGKLFRTLARSEVLRGWVLSHIIHHRAQLGVYLRLCDVAVPAHYGPTADDEA